VTKKVILAFPWGPEEVIRAETLFYLASTARDMELDTTVFLFIDGVLLAKKGVAEMVSERVVEGLKDALNTGIKVYACEASVRSKGLTKADLIEGISIIGYSTFLAMAIESETVITI
jgi:predicted peroxiredoxin